MSRVGLLRRWRADRSASIAVEAAFAMVLLMAMLLPLLDFGGYIGTRMELKQALRAGGQSALDDYANTTKITTTIKAAASLKSVAVQYDNPNTFCLCNSGAAGTCVGDAGFSVCADGAPAGRFMRIRASAPYDPYVPSLPWFAANMTVTEQLTLRVQ